MAEAATGIVADPPHPPHNHTPDDPINRMKPRPFFPAAAAAGFGDLRERSPEARDRFTAFEISQRRWRIRDWMNSGRERDWRNEFGGNGEELRSAKSGRIGFVESASHVTRGCRHVLFFYAFLFPLSILSKNNRLHRLIYLLDEKYSRYWHLFIHFAGNTSNFF